MVDQPADNIICNIILFQLVLVRLHDPEDLDLTDGILDAYADLGMSQL